MTFIENLKRICTEKNTSPTALCKSLGYSTSKVGAWYNGSLPKERVMIELANALDCSVMDFFVDEEDLEEEEPLSDDELDILNIYRNLDRENKHKFMAMVYGYESSNIR